MWTTSCLPDPIASNSPSKSCLVHSKVSIDSLLSEDATALGALKGGGRAARVALADFCSRRIVDKFRQNLLTTSPPASGCQWEPLDCHASSSRGGKASSNQTPYVLERTDVWSTETEVNIILRARVNAVTNTDDTQIEALLETATAQMLGNVLSDITTNVMKHAACAVAQNRLRDCVAQKQAVAFIADGAILPRKSGANSAPMVSPPAVPCRAPEDSTLKQTLQVDMGSLRPYLDRNEAEKQSTMLTITGMLIPKGITLVAGGGYHGKSTLLRAVAAGVYDKIPGDGREFCVTVPDTISIRAEDGRYVNNCNVSGFISNLPTPPGVTQTIDTTRFGSGEASGSTSQAANVVEAIEMGAKAFLVDEDVSAANFMARDGRMRALVMDESITPLLYRVNGMYNTLGISCVVVVGGVGDWLDVPDQVILLNKYVASDATKKARSISKQFSHGHVQYAGRGVVHQLPWDKSGTPLQRKPTDAFLSKFEPDVSTISLLDGGHAISVHRATAGDDDAKAADSIYDDDDDGYIDLSRCEQLVGKKPQLYGCGQCVIWLLREAKRQPGLGIAQHLSNLETTIDTHGMPRIFADNAESLPQSSSLAWKHLLQASGFAYRPRKYEIGQAFTRMRGIVFEHIPGVVDEEEERIAREAEERKQALAKLWASRRPKNVAAGQQLEGISIF